jgi:hypothetical protein
MLSLRLSTFQCINYDTFLPERGAITPFWFLSIQVILLLVDRVLLENRLEPASRRAVPYCPSPFDQRRFPAGR